MEEPIRRKLFTALVAAGILSPIVPTIWKRPVVEAVMLPAHAQTSPGGDDNGDDNGDNGDDDDSSDDDNGDDDDDSSDDDDDSSDDDPPPEKECTGTKKIEDDDIGVSPQKIYLGDFSFTITGWTPKDGEPEEFVGFTTDKPVCFTIKAGPTTHPKACGTSWTHPNGTGGPTVKAISNITFSCPE